MKLGSDVSSLSTTAANAAAQGLSIVVPLYNEAAGLTSLHERLVGLAKAKEMVLTAEIIDAAEALRIGLVNRVVPAAELESATRALAGKIATGPPLAATIAKSLLNRAATVDLAAALEGEAFGQSNAISSEDHAEGVRAFLEKRAPKFQGR